MMTHPIDGLEYKILRLELYVVMARVLHMPRLNILVAYNAIGITLYPLAQEQPCAFHRVSFQPLKL